MERASFEGIVDLALSTLGSFAASTETKIDDTLCRFLVFFRNDPAFEAWLDKRFSEHPLALTFGVDDDALALFDRFRGQAPKLSTGEFVNELLPILLQLFALIRKARQDKKNAPAPPAAAA